MKFARILIGMILFFCTITYIPAEAFVVPIERGKKVYNEGTYSIPVSFKGDLKIKLSNMKEQAVFMIVDKETSELKYYICLDEVNKEFDLCFPKVSSKDSVVVIGDKCVEIELKYGM